MSMTSILRGDVVRILVLAWALFGTRITLVAFSQSTDSNASDYVTIKLKDGRALEGLVLLEDDQQITIDAQFANGTITRKDQVSKSDIASISHLSAVDRDQRLATVAYHDLGKYQLDPQNSYPLSYYDSAINQGFLPFLQQYPHVMETAVISNRLTEWQAERDKVASGQVKYHGQWMPAAEADKLTETERTQQIIQDVRALMGTRPIRGCHRTACAVLQCRPAVGAGCRKPASTGRCVSVVDQQPRNRAGTTHQGPRSDQGQGRPPFGDTVTSPGQL